jgi:hypothetical protein
VGEEKRKGGRKHNSGSSQDPVLKNKKLKKITGLIH